MPSVEELCKGLDSSDQVQAYQARQALVKLVGEAGAKGQTQQAAELAATLAAQLTAEEEKKDDKGKVTKQAVLSPKARNEIVRALALVGGEPQIAAMKQAMLDFDVREMARWALDRMTCQGATDALVEVSVKAIGPEFRLGAINSLGRKSGSNVVAALKKCAQDPNFELRLAAAEALANLPDASGDEAITAAAGKSNVGAPRGNRRLAKARIRLAETLVRSGQKDAGKKVYAAVAQGEYDEVQKKAASAALSRLS
jgi:hypothetical protein